MSGHFCGSDIVHVLSVSDRVTKWSCFAGNHPSHRVTLSDVAIL